MPSAPRAPFVVALVVGLVVVSACAGRTELVVADEAAASPSIVDIQACIDAHGRGHDLSYAPGLSASEYLLSCRRDAEPRANCEPARWISGAAVRCIGAHELGESAASSASVFLADARAIQAYQGPVWRVASAAGELFIDACTGAVLRWPTPAARR